MMYTLQDLFFSASLAVYVAASMIFAAVRWGHKCEPYARHMDYYYPAWKVLVGCYLANLLMLPAFFLPQDADAVLQLRLLFILASPFFCSILLFSYFGKILGNPRWRQPVFFLAIPFAIMAISATVLALVPGTQLQGTFCRVYFAIGGTLALIFLGSFFFALRMLIRELRRSLEQEYSNPNDFPRRFASGMVWVPLVHLLVSWIAAYIGTQPALSAGLLALSVLSVFLLIGVLSPHRALQVEQLEKELAHRSAPAAKETGVLPEARKDEIECAIRRFVEEGRAYLDQGLTVTRISESVGVNRTYVSIVLSERFGGFFDYIKRCRIAHAARLKNEHPDISESELIDNSGFSRSTYYKIRRQLKEL